MKTPIFFLSLLFAVSAIGQEVFMATEESLDQFDQMVEQSDFEEELEESPAEESEFGQWVAKEAKTLKDATVEERQAFGGKVSEKVRKDQEHRPEESFANDPSATIRENLPNPSQDIIKDRTSDRPGVPGN